MGATSIEWTRGADGAQGHTINPFRARLRSDPSKVGHYCEKVSPGCTFCYSSRFQPRRHLPEFSGTHGRNLELVEPFLDVSKLDEVLRRRKPTTYFWCDMTDMFGRWVSNEQIAACFGVMAATPWHTHQVLTKRAERLPEFLRWLDRTCRGYAHGIRGRLADLLSMADEDLSERAWQASCDFRAKRNGGPPKSLGDAMAWPWPLPNVWIGVSVEDQQRADERIPLLLQCQSAVRFLSCEPLLGPLDLTAVGAGRVKINALNGGWAVPSNTAGHCQEPRIHWVICGGESGPGARPMRPEWARSLRDQCVAAGVPYFFKQWGAWAPDWEGAETCAGCGGEKWEHVDRDGECSNCGACNWSPAGRPLDDLRLVGKKAAGRVLDGRTWDEMPELIRG